jgi:hypothetical protein
MGLKTMQIPEIKIHVQINKDGLAAYAEELVMKTVSRCSTLEKEYFIAFTR